MRHFLATTFVAAAVLAGCAEGATDPEPTELTRQEAIQLAALVGVTGADRMEAGWTSNSRSTSGEISAFRPATLRQDLDISGPCPLGGNVGLEGEVEVEAENHTGSIEAAFIVTHDDCKVNTDEGPITLDGRPSLAFTGAFAWANDQQSQPLRLTSSGNVAWARDSGAAGTCQVDLISVTDFIARRRTVDGTFCGFEIQEELTWTP
jgi:hypothetical protein